MTTLLQTKLYIPPPQRPSLVPRPRLIKKINEGLGNAPPFARKLTLISAPAGFGKSTLVVAWLHTRNDNGNGGGPWQRCGWLSLDEGDNDPARFFAYVIAALRRMAAGMGEPAQALLRAQPPQLEAVVTTLINEVAAAGSAFVLVVDDYHVIEQQAIHEALSFLLDHQPPNMHLVITTREDPLLPVARLRARGQVTEIRAEDLRFTAVEVAHFLNEVMALQLSPQQVAALEAHTEGWIVGLQLAALSMQGQEDTAAFIDTFSGSHRYILDYLTAEVLAQQPEAVQRFLLQTAILNRLSGPLCNALTERQDGRKMLEQLDAANLFLIPLDNERRWYRYHHLFAELLRNQLQQRQPQQVPQLHLRAAAWYQSQEMITEAMHHAFAAGDRERLLDLLETYAPVFVRRAEMGTVLSWLEKLPGGQWQRRPQLCLAFAWGLFLNSRYAEIEPFLQSAETAVGGKASEAETAAVLGEIATMRSFLARLHKDEARANELARQALAQVPQSNAYVHGLIRMSLGGSYKELGNTAAAINALSEAIPLCETAANYVGAALATIDLAQLLIAGGQLRRAAEICRQTLARAARLHMAQSPAFAIVYIGLGRVLYEQYELDEARDCLQQTIASGKMAGYHQPLFHAYSVLALVLQAQGKEDEANEAMEQATRLMLDKLGAVNTFAGAWFTYAWLRQGNVEAALQWVEESPFSVHDTPQDAYTVEYTAVARTHIARYREQREEAALRDVFTLLERMRLAAAATERHGHLIEILVIEAMAHHARRAFDQALSKLQQALKLAAPEGHVRVFVGEGAPMATLLENVEAEEGSVQNLIDKLRPFLPKADPASGQPMPLVQPLPDPLSERELEVLHLIAQKLKYREIAERLFVSLNTVRFHVKNIYSKLDANRRDEAVRKARELNLLRE